MIGGIKKIKVLRGKEAQFETLVDQLQQEVKNKEAGNIYYNLYRSQTSPLHYVVMERYRDKEALEQHKNSAHGALFFPQIRELLEELEVEYFESVD